MTNISTFVFPALSAGAPAGPMHCGLSGGVAVSSLAFGATV